MRYLVIGRNAPGAASVPVDRLLATGEATLEALASLEGEGRVRGGVHSSGAGMAFVLDVDSNEEVHRLLTSLPSFSQAAWEVTPLISFARDLEVVRRAIEATGGA